MLLSLVSMQEVTQENRVIVRDMLGKLTERIPDLTWRINNTYTDGLENTVLEILLFEEKTQTGRIAFQLEDGHVINYRYKSLEKRLPVHIVDMLLDVISYEMD